MATSSTGPALGGDIAAYRGDTFERWIQIKRNGVEENLSSSEFNMHIRSGATLIKSLTSTNGAGITIEELNGGVLALSITADQMAEMPVGAFVYDMSQNYPDGKVKTRFRGSFTVSDDVTKPIA